MLYHNGFSHWLSAGIICLLVGGTLAAKAVFLVDNELESQTEFSGEQWQLDSHQDLEKLTYKYIDRLTKLPDRKAWCGSAQEISMVLAKAKNLHSIELNNLTAGKADIIVKLPADRSMPIPSSQSPVKNLHLYVNPDSQPAPAEQSWCIAAGASNK
jgi:hypothetical protein